MDSKTKDPKAPKDGSAEIFAATDPFRVADGKNPKTRISPRLAQAVDRALRANPGASPDDLRQATGYTARSIRSALAARADSANPPESKADSASDLLGQAFDESPASAGGRAHTGQLRGICGVRADSYLEMIVDTILHCFKADHKIGVPYQSIDPRWEGKHKTDFSFPSTRVVIEVGRTEKVSDIKRRKDKSDQANRLGFSVFQVLHAGSAIPTIAAAIAAADAARAAAAGREVPIIADVRPRPGTVNDGRTRGIHQDGAGRSAPGSSAEKISAPENGISVPAPSAGSPADDNNPGLVAPASAPSFAPQGLPLSGSPDPADALAARLADYRESRMDLIDSAVGRIEKSAADAAERAYRSAAWDAGDGIPSYDRIQRVRARAAARALDGAVAALSAVRPPVPAPVVEPPAAGGSVDEILARLQTDPDAHAPIAEAAAQGGTAACAALSALADSSDEARDLAARRARGEKISDSDL